MNFRGFPIRERFGILRKNSTGGEFTMPSRPFRVYVYEVEATSDSTRASAFPLDGAITQVDNSPLHERAKYVNQKRYRLDHIERREDCFLINFVTLAYDGPGRARIIEPVQNIGLAPDEHFSYETALLYDINTNLLFLEAGFTSMRSGSVSEYFEHYCPDFTNYTLVPLLDPQAASRARLFQTIRKVSLRVALGQATEADYEAGLGSSVAFGENYGARFMNIDLSVGQEPLRTLSRENVLRLIDRVVGGSSDGEVTKLKVRGREHIDDPIEEIDLIAHREKRERTLPVDDESRKIAHLSRWDALFEIRNEFMA